MKILLASAEATPFVKIGGLGDIVSTIAKSVAKCNHDVKVVLPLYSIIDRSNLSYYDQPMIINMGYGIEFARIWSCIQDNVEFLFIEFEKYFGRSGVYCEYGIGYCDNWERFSFFSRAVIDLCDFLNWIPDVIHSNDWHAGLIPVLLREQLVYRLSNTASVFTIHNMAYHGYGPRELLTFVGLPEKLFNSFALEACGAVNIMKGALLYADKITTVSPNYVNEIKTPEYGCGLDGILRYRAADLIGICNAVDTTVWSPEKDKFIPSNFSYKNMKGKGKCKLALQKRVGLNIDKNILLIGIIARFVEQKGLDLVCDLLPQWLNNLHVQFVILGSGDKQLEEQFLHHMCSNQGRISVTIGYDEGLAHLIEAGIDCFLMPSRYEPCGMNQMYSMLYGSLPIVHATGGLYDTVENYDAYTHCGTGFVFYDFNAQSLYDTTCWACSTYYDHKGDFISMQKQAMKKDFSLTKLAEQYMNVYQYSIACHDNK